ncbi:low temperature requirement protein A [Actinoallomurus sp. NPDC052308]|uniref:low temperature requirement protein A n=1 Tax=Actinoallomurus sp. NPDC052308 TaxID=3155530 RepID=UPI00342EFE61
MPQVRRGAGAEGRRTATPELFYDLVFVFAITQVSHVLLGNLTWAGAGEAMMVLLAVWWSWNYTTWATNELDPDSTTVRVLLIALMLASLLMAIAIPGAFGDEGLLFAGAYVTIQVGRHVFLTFVAAASGTIERERAGRILIWFIAAGVFWIAGGIADGEARVALWFVALALDYGAPLVLFQIPGRPRPAGETWQVAVGHFAERFGLFVIIALGETIVLTGATTAGLDLDATTVTAFGGAFLGTAALWWSYFTSIRELAEHALTEAASRTQVARDVYTYGHVLIIAGIILTAVGDELVIAHSTEELASAQMTAVVSGPATYLLAQATLRLRVTGAVSHRLVAGALACVAIGFFGTPLPALAVGGLLVVVLLAVIMAKETDRSGRLPAEERAGVRDRRRCVREDQAVAAEVVRDAEGGESLVVPRLDPRDEHGDAALLPSALAVATLSACTPVTPSAAGTC